MVINFIQNFWLLVWDLFLPMVLVVIIPIVLFHLCDVLKASFFEKKERIKQQVLAEESKKEYEQEVTIPLSKKRVLYAIAEMAKERYVGGPELYRSSAGREMLLEDYQKFFKELGFK